MAEGYDDNGVSIHYNKLIENPDDSRLSIPRLRLGSLDDLALSTDTHVYYGNDRLKRGLKEYIRTNFGKSEVPTYIVDSHHHAFFGWAEALNESVVEPGATLLHIDNHDDSSFPGNFDVDISDMTSVRDYILSLKIYECIEPAFRTGMISNVVWVHPRYQVNNDRHFVETREGFPCAVVSPNSPIVEKLLSDVSRNKLIVDIDLDYFNLHHEDPSWLLIQRGEDNIENLIDNDLAVVAKAINSAGLVTMATSPGFIDQELAIQLIKKLDELSP